MPPSYTNFLIWRFQHETTKKTPPSKGAIKQVRQTHQGKQKIWVR